MEYHGTCYLVAIKLPSVDLFFVFVFCSFLETSHSLSPCESHMGKKARKMRSADLLDPKHDAQQNEQIGKFEKYTRACFIDKKCST